MVGASMRVRVRSGQGRAVQGVGIIDYRRCIVG